MIFRVLRCKQIQIAHLTNTIHSLPFFYKHGAIKTIHSFRQYQSTSFSELYSQTSSIPKFDATYYLFKYGNLLKWQPYKERILEFGCGDGFVTREILYPFAKNHVESIVAVDVQPYMIEIARKGNYIDKIDFQIMDITNDEIIEDMSEKFRHILSFYCIHWIPDQRQLMKHLHKMLKPGGQIFITAVTDSPLHKAFQKFQKDTTWSEFLPKTTAFTDFTENPEGHVHKILEGAGFDVDLCKLENRTGTLPDANGFAKSIVGLHPYLEYIPYPLRQEYIENFIEASREFSVQLNNSNIYEVAFQSLVFIASKKS